MSSADGQVFDRSTKVTLREGSQYGAALATDGAALYLFNLSRIGHQPKRSLNVQIRRECACWYEPALITVRRRPLSQPRERIAESVRSRADPTARDIAPRSSGSARRAAALRCGRGRSLICGSSRWFQDGRK